MSKNDITGDSIHSRHLSDKGRANHDKIFGKQNTPPEQPAAPPQPEQPAQLYLNPGKLLFTRILVNGSPGMIDHVGQAMRPDGRMAVTLVCVPGEFSPALYPESSQLFIEA